MTDHITQQKWIQTVTGQIAHEQIGITLMHEHLLLDMRVWFVEPKSGREIHQAYEPVSLENLGWVRYNYSSNLDNLQFTDERVAVDELEFYKSAGGNSVVDLTSIGLGRSPLALRRISQETGINVVMGTGYYVQPDDSREATGSTPTEDEMTERIVRDITVGVADTGVRAGIIGEVAIRWPMCDFARRSLRAAAHGQTETGAGINVHPGRSPDSPFEALDVLDGAGGDVGRVVMSHVDRTLFEHTDRVRLAQTGCYIEYDQFSFDGWSPFRMVRSEAVPVQMDMLSDAARIDDIIRLVEEGFLEQILISHDHCHKHRLRRYGGPGFSHILDNVVPLMQRKGMSSDAISTILERNPRRLLQLA